MAAARTVTVSFLGNTRDLEAALERAGISADVAGKQIGDKFTEGTNKAATGLNKLSSLGASWGIPFMGSLDKIGEKLDQAESKTSKFSTALQEAGKVTLLAGTAGFAVAAGEAVKLGEKFQSTTASIQANAGITQKAAQNIGNAFLDTAGKSTFSGQQMASAYAAVAGQLKLTEGAALSTAQASKVMAAASDLAEASQTDLGTATQALAGVMQAYHLGVSQAADASNVLFNASKATGVGVQALGQAADRLHGRLGVLAPSLQDVTGLMVEMAEHGVTGSRGVMQVNTALQTLVGGSSKTDAVLKSLGVTLYNSRGQFVGIQSVIEQMQPKLAGLTQQQQLYVAQTLFGKSAGQAMLGIIQSGVSAYQQATSTVSKNNAVQAAAQAQAHTLHGEMETLKATVQDLGTKFGLFLIPKLQQLGTWLSDGVTWLEKHKSAAIALGAAIAGPLALAVAAFIAGQAAGFVTAIGKMGAGMISLATQSKATAAEVEASDAAIVESADATAAGVDTALGSTGIGLVLVGLGVAASELMTHWQTVMNAMKSAVNTMVQAAESALNGLISVLTIAINLFNSTIGQLTGSVGTIGKVGVGGVFGTSLPTQMDMAPGGAGGAVPIPSSGSNAAKIAGALKAQGFSNVAIAGILGNFAQETGGGSLASINTRDSGTGASGMGGMGIAQWTMGRRQSEIDYSAIHHESPTSLAAQIGFLVQELRTNYHSTYTAISKAKTPQQAASIFNQMFEGGTDPGGVREQAAVTALAMLTGGGAGTGGLSTVAGFGNSALQSLINAASKGSTKSVKSLLYANPFPGGATVGRTDQGVDFSATPGSPVDAIGKGIVTAIINNWYKGQPLIEEQLTQGPDKGKYIYYAEQIQSLVHMGQQVSAGQRIGTVAPSGTGLELGFGAPGGETLARATTGYVEGEQTPAGKAFATFLKSIGSGVYQTTSGGVTTGGGTNIGYTIAQAVQAFITALDKTTTSLIQNYQSLEQSGTAKTISKALGISTGGKTAGALRVAIEGLNVSQLESSLAAGNDPHQLDQKLIPILEKASSKSQATQTFNTLVAELKASGQTGQANALISARGGLFSTLAQEMFAQQVTKDAESIQLQATQEKDRTQLAADTANKQVTIAKDQSQKVVDQITSMATQIKDQTQIITDTFQSIATQISDATQVMADAANSAVQGINDQTQTQVDILGERGLYGLNLIAQQQTVQLDQMKASYDQQIAAAQAQLDATKSTWDAAVSNAQLSLDQVQLQEDAKVSLAQAHMDTVQLGQDTKIAAAQAHVDSVTLANDVAVQMAQSVVDLSANAPKAQQDAANAQLKRATSQSNLSIANAQNNLTNVSDAATAAITAASDSFNVAQAQATEMIGHAQQTLASVQGQATASINQAQQNLQIIQDTANIAEATQQGVVSVTQARAQTQFAGSGLVVNMYGIPLDNATAIGTEMDWFARTALGALS